MRNHRFSFARLLIAVLVTVLAFAVAIPAFAEESAGPYLPGPFNVKITPDESTAKPKDEKDTGLVQRFTAYAIFVGDIDHDYNPTVPGDKEPVSNRLMNIEWGEGINVAAFMKSLLSDTTDKLQNGKTIAEELDNYLPQLSEQADSEDYDFTTTAVARAVASFLEANIGDSALMQAFARLANSAIVEESGIHSTWTEGDKGWDDGVWNIKLEEAGFYLLVDEFRSVDSDDNPTTDTVSSYIVGVFGDSTVNMKSTTPTPDKTITNPDDDGNGNGSAFEIGDVINFELTGTLPENYGMYDTYYYAFHDTMSAGLTYLPDEGVTMTIVTGDEKLELSADKSDFEIGYVLNADGTTSLTFTIKDLKALAAAKNFPIDYRSTVHVTYSATINEDSVIYGADGNPNALYLEYSNNPHNDSHGRSSEKEVYVYTFGLDLNKLAGDTKESLPGAKFEITNSEGKIGYFTTVTTTSEDGVKTTVYILEGWLAEGESVPEGKDTIVVTDESGHLNVRGLGSDSYSLKETEAPKGFNLLKYTIDVDIKTEVTEDGKLLSFTVTVTMGDQTTTTVYKALPEGSDAEEDVFNAGVFHTGLIPQDVFNDRAPILPGTGGAGLVIFYVVGGLLLAGAAVFIILNGRKKNKGGQQ